MPRHPRKWFFPHEDDDWEERAELYEALERALHGERRAGEHDEYLGDLELSDEDDAEEPNSQGDDSEDE